MAHREGVPRTRPGLRTTCLPTRRRMLSGGLLPLWAGPARKILGSGPSSKRGFPTRRRILSGGPKCLIVRGSPGRGLVCGRPVSPRVVECCRVASCPSGPARKILGSGPSSKRGFPTRRRMLSGGPKCLIVRGSPGQGLEIAIFWVSAWSVVLRAFLEPGRSVSC